MQKLFTQTEPGQIILVELVVPVCIKFKISWLNSFQIRAIYEFLKQRGDIYVSLLTGYGKSLA